MKKKIKAVLAIATAGIAVGAFIMVNKKQSLKPEQKNISGNRKNNSDKNAVNDKAGQAFDDRNEIISEINRYRKLESDLTDLQPYVDIFKYAGKFYTAIMGISRQLSGDMFVDQIIKLSTVYDFPMLDSTGFNVKVNISDYKNEYYNGESDSELNEILSYHADLCKKYCINKTYKEIVNRTGTYLYNILDLAYNECRDEGKYREYIHKIEEVFTDNKCKIRFLNELDDAEKNELRTAFDVDYEGNIDLPCIYCENNEIKKIVLAGCRGRANTDRKGV